MNAKRKLKYTRDDSLTALYFHTARQMHRISGTDYSQQKVMRILNENENVTQKDLLEYLQIKAGSLSELLKKLEDKGLIQKEKNEADRRQTVIRLTEEGEKSISSYSAVKDDILFAKLNREERMQLRKLLEKMNREE